MSAAQITMPPGKGGIGQDTNNSDVKVIVAGTDEPRAPLVLDAAVLGPIVSRVRTDVTAKPGRDKSGNDAMIWTREALTTARMQEHLNGGTARGCCPIKAGESTTRLALMDLDSHKGETPWIEMQRVAAEVSAHLMGCGLRPIPFRSRGGRGVHLYMLWDEPQDAYSVRQTLKGALLALGLKDGSGGVAVGQIEVFPKQDSVPLDGYGNMFILPFAGKSEPLELARGMKPMGREWVRSMQWPICAPVAAADRPPPRKAITSTGQDAAMACRALAVIPNEYDRGQWFELLCSFKEAAGEDGYSAALEWSAQHTSHEQAKFDKAWGSITVGRENGTPAAHLYAVAFGFGFTEHILADFEDEVVNAKVAAAELFALVDTADLVGLEPADLLAEVRSRLPATNLAIEEANALITKLTKQTGAPPAEVKEKLGLFHALRFEVIPAAEFASGPPPRWIVRDVLPEAELCVIYGESGSGKSFFVLDLVAAVAQGIEWRGRKVKQGSVVYVAAEGAGGFRKRLTAYAQNAGIALNDLPLGVVPAAPNLLTNDDQALTQAVAAAGGASVIVIDTLAQTTPGGNENAGEDMGRALSHCKRLHAATGALIVLIHHSGKDATKGARGWSGIRAAVDAEIEVSRSGDARLVKITKQKDGEDNASFPFCLRQVELGQDEDGFPISSCAVDYDNVPAPAGPARRMGQWEQLVYDVVSEFALAQNSGIEINAVITEAMRQAPTPEPGKRDTRKQRVRRALEALCKGDDAPFCLEDGALAVLI